MARWVVAGLSFVLGALLLVLAVPRTIAAWYGFGARITMHDQVDWGKSPSPEDAAAGIAGLKQAIEWVPSARRLVDLATLELEYAKSLSFQDPRREEILRSAEAHFIEGLTLNPVDGLAWLRLAWTRSFLGASARSVVSCLVQSIDMAPNRREVWQPRARMLLAYWPWMNDEEKDIVQRQLRTIWTVDSMMEHPLVRIAHELNRLPVLEQAIGDDPKALAQFKAIRASLPK